MYEKKKSNNSYYNNTAPTLVERHLVKLRWRLISGETQCSADSKVGRLF